VLSKKEFALLRALAEEPTRVYTREELLMGVWGFRAVGNARKLCIHISQATAGHTASGRAGERNGPSARFPLSISTRCAARGRLTKASHIQRSERRSRPLAASVDKHPMGP
jgi:hypothetical protein